MVDEKDFKDRWPTLFANVSCGFYCPDEWRDLVWKLCEDLEKLPGFENISVVQVKSKFGGLRFYTEVGGSQEAAELIDKAECQSFAIKTIRQTRDGKPV